MFRVRVIKLLRKVFLFEFINFWYKPENISLDATSKFYFSLPSCSFASVDGKYKFSCVHVICQSFLLRFYYVLGLWSYWDFPSWNFFSLRKICWICHGFDWLLCWQDFWLHFYRNFLETHQKRETFEKFNKNPKILDEAYVNRDKRSVGHFQRQQRDPTYQKSVTMFFVNIWRKLSIVVSTLISVFVSQSRNISTAQKLHKFFNNRNLFEAFTK